MGQKIVTEYCKRLAINWVMFRHRPNDPDARLRNIQPLRIILTTMLPGKSDMYRYLLTLSDTREEGVTLQTTLEHMENGEFQANFGH